MTNPGNAVGTNAAYSGRTSVNAFNDDLAAYTNGILSGWGCSPSAGLTVVLGGDGNTRDVAIAVDNAGNKTTINNISGSPISVTIDTPPASNSRIDSVVAYVDNPPEGVASTADNPAACGLITVEGTAAANPTAPNDSAIRTAITADGASGSTAYYVVLANVTIASGTTTLTSDDIKAGSSAGITSNNIDFTTLPVLSSTTTSETSGTITSVTVTEAGKYLVIGSGSGYNVSGTGSLSLAIQINGVNTDYYQRYGASTSNRYGMTIAGIVDVSVGDVISVYSARIDGGSAQIRSGFFLGVFRVG